MVTLTNFKANLTSILELATQDTITLKLGFKERVYRVSINLLDEPYYYKPPKKHKARRLKNTKKTGIKLTKDTCPTCGYPMLEGICTSRAGTNGAACGARLQKQTASPSELPSSSPGAVTPS